MSSWQSHEDTVGVVLDVIHESAMDEAYTDDDDTKTGHCVEAKTGHCGEAKTGHCGEAKTGHCGIGIIQWQWNKSVAVE